MFNALFTAKRAAAYEAQRHQAHLDQLRAATDRADKLTLIGLTLVLLFIAWL